MTETKSHKKKWIIAGSVLLALVLLIGGIRLMLKSDWLFDKVRDVVIEQANEQLNGTLAIHSIRGDLLSGFTIYDVVLAGDDGENIAKIDSVSLEYRLTDLIRSPHELNRFTLSGTELWLTQYEDSTWNVMHLAEFEDTDEVSDPVYWLLNHADIRQLNLYVQSEHMLPDGFVNITSLDAAFSGGMLEDGFFANLDALDFYVEEARLPEPVAIYLQGSGADEKVTLESLVVNTGRTFIKGRAEYEEPGRLGHELEISPLSWQDLALYFDDMPLQQDIGVTLSAAGTLEELNLGLNLTATGAEEISFNAVLALADNPSLTRAEFSTGVLNLPLLTGLEDLPIIQSIYVSGEGLVPFDDIENAQIAGEFGFNELSLAPYSLHRFHSDFELDRGSGFLNLNAWNNGEQIVLQSTFSELFNDLPEYTAELRTDQFNPANWLPDEDLDASLNIRVQATGSGFSPDNFNTQLVAALSGTRFGDQPFTEIRFSGDAGSERISGNVTAQLGDSRAVTDFGIDNWMELPSYQFGLEVQQFNTAEITGLEHFPTNLNGKISGSGESFDIENMQLLAEMSFDSSIVNGELINAFRASLTLDNMYATVDDGILDSPIADATFSFRHHISDFMAPDNQARFEAVLKDLYPVAPLFGFEELLAEGSLHGRLERNDAGTLQFDGGLDFENIRVDTLFSTTSLKGTVTSYLYDEPEIIAGFELRDPSVMNVGVQDLILNTSARLAEEGPKGSMNLRLINGDQSSLYHEADFEMDSLRVLLRTQDLRFETELKTLGLMRPFDLTYADNVVRMDTLSISAGENDSYMKLWIPHLDTLRQEIGLDARDLDIGELQQTLIDQRFVDAYLSGTILVNNQPDELAVSATGLLSSLRYEEGSMDSLRFDASIAEEWLDAELNGWLDNNRIVDGFLRVPFLPGDPQTFDEQFFEREVEGRFHLPSSPLSYWLAFTPDGVPEETAGNISINANLSGTAGSPELTGGLAVTEGLFSGITVDRIGIDLDYSHDSGAITFNGNVVKDQTSILGFDANLPFLVDLRALEILLPSDEDRVFLNFRTEDFDMALFNSYVDPAVIRNISGRIEGNVTLAGTLANLQTDGELRLQNGTMRVVEAGITLNEIGANILFESDQILMREFTVRSGPGRLRASGSVAMDGLEPGEMNLQMTANQFRAINTSEYNFLVNLQTALRGTFDQPRLTGNLTFLTGLVNLQDFGDQTVEAVVLDDEEEPEPFDFFNSMAIEMNVDFGRQFLIRNRQFLDMDLALTGNLDLLKEPSEDLQLFGTLEGTRGFVRPLGRNFELDEAVVSFFGPIDNPQMNVRTRYEPPQAAGVQIFYVIEGTLTEPEFRFESNPELELQDIVSYTLFGKPFYDLDSWEQVVAGSGSSPTAADVALDILLDRVEMLASQRLGIDVVQIDNTRSGSNNTTSIKTGWFLNQRTFFAILSEVGGARPRTLFMLEYLLRDNLELIITQGDDSREGVDLRWKLDY